MKTLTTKNLKKGFLVMILVGCSNQVHAQGPAIAQPLMNWSYTGHSSSIVEGTLRGQSAVISSMGETVYMDSLAAINYAEAYKRAIENSVAVTKAYYERRELRNEYNLKYSPKAFVGGPRKKFIEYYSPKRLSAQEFDSQRGAVTWPHILRQEQFAPVKEQIDQVFSTRDATNTGNGSATHREVIQLCQAMSGLLRENIGGMTPDQYLNALEFIRSVELEARTALSVDIKPVLAPLGDEKPAEAVPPPIKSDTDTTSLSKATTRVKT